MAAGYKVPTWFFPMVLPIPRAERELLTLRLKRAKSTLYKHERFAQVQKLW